MHAVTITFDRGRETDASTRTFEVVGNVVRATEDAIIRILNKEKRAINKWLLFGRVNMNVCFQETGEVIATGWYDYNAFSGHGEYKFQMER